MIIVETASFSMSLLVWLMKHTTDCGTSVDEFTLKYSYCKYVFISLSGLPAFIDESSWGKHFNSIFNVE